LREDEEDVWDDSGSLTGKKVWQDWRWTCSMWLKISAINALWGDCTGIEDMAKDPHERIQQFLAFSSSPLLLTKFLQCETP
jgi:hypothetical protein